jgi:hypothetical protein
MSSRQDSPLRFREKGFKEPGSCPQLWLLTVLKGDLANRGAFGKEGWVNHICFGQSATL